MGENFEGVRDFVKNALFGKRAVERLATDRGIVKKTIDGASSVVRGCGITATADEILGNCGYKTTLDALENMSEPASKACKAVKTVGNAAGKITDGLMFVKAGYNVATAEKGEKLKTATIEGAGIAGMYGASKALKSVAKLDKVVKFTSQLPKTGKLGVLTAIGAGALAVAASVAGIEAGRTAATVLVGQPKLKEQPA